MRLHCPDPATLEDKLAEGKKITVIPLVRLSSETGERDSGLFHGRTGEDFTKRFAEEALKRDEIVSDSAQADLDAGLVQLYRKARTRSEERRVGKEFVSTGRSRWWPGNN